MTLKQQVEMKLRLEVQRSLLPWEHFSEDAAIEISRHILDLVKVHLENGGTLDD